MRKALIVGIDHYTELPDLAGCVHDARAVGEALRRNADGRHNFAEPRIVTAPAPGGLLVRTQLRAAVESLFEGRPEIALFYFAGHGWIDDTGGFLCASDSTAGHDGLALSDVMTFANRSDAQNKVIILDCCHGGVAGERALSRVSEVATGMTILTASTAEQYSVETRTGGVFTTLLVDALDGAAANLVGAVTPGSVYAHIDQSLGPWAQRPVFKTNVDSFVSLRTATPPIDGADLLAITTLFPTPDHRIRLDPTYEPERSTDQRTLPPPDPAHTAVFRVLQNYVKVNLVRPLGAPHMWHAAINGKSCELTVLGRHYWRLVDKGLL
ncbi:caspase family protein [Cryptosporangium japonicum]|uniref:Caspase family protein n=1 Tax=Cryptosporangium japonicum TaxID=80872 RepID=A0ABN0V4E9_9ACTN